MEHKGWICPICEVGVNPELDMCPCCEEAYEDEAHEIHIQLPKGYKLDLE